MLSAGSGCPAPSCDDGDLCVVLGTGALGFNGDGLPPLETMLASPTSVREAPGGGPLVVDFSNMRLRVIGDDGLVTTLVGDGTHAYSEPGAAADATPLENPIDARWGPDGLLYIAPLHEGRVIRIGANGTVELVAGTGASLAHGGDGGDALDATMGYPGGLAFDADGTLYLSDSTNHRIRRVSLDGTIETVAGTGERGFDRAGRGTDVRLSSPAMLEVDRATDRLLIADRGNDRVAVLDLETGELTTLAGTGEPGWDGDGGPSADAMLDEPYGLAAADDGTIWIAEVGNDVVRRVTPDGTIDTVAGSRDQVAAADVPLGAPALEFPLRGPAGIELLPDGDLLLAERSGHRVVRWTPEPSP